MTLTVEVVPAERAVDEDLRADLLRVWAEVTDAGGSVGFAPPAPVDEIQALLRRTLQSVAAGVDTLLVLRDDDGRAVGMGILAAGPGALFAHWRTVLKVMVDPALQGTGAGRLIVEALHEEGRRLGLDHLHLSVRSGEGLEAFYERFGYRVVGTHPGAVRLSPTDERDEVFLLADL